MQEGRRARIVDEMRASVHLDAQEVAEADLSDVVADVLVVIEGPIRLVANERPRQNGHIRLETR